MTAYRPLYRTIEPGIRQYATGNFIAIITRNAGGRVKSFVRAGLRSIGAARAALAELRAAHPKLKQGRKPGPQGRRVVSNHKS